MRKLLAVSLIALFLSGCTVGPNYKRPAMQPPPTFFPQTAAQQESLADLAWWDLFKDPVLQDLIKQALKNNYDVAIAASRVEQARTQYENARSVYYPQIGYGTGIAGQRAPGIPNHTYYSYNFNLSWEIDLWGRIRRLNEQQRALFFSSEEVQRGVWLSLVTAVAQAYFELRALDEQMLIVKETGDSFQQTYDLFNKKLQGGAASGLETSRAEGALADVLSQIPDLEAQITAKENQISLLLGTNPAAIPRGTPLEQQNDMDVIPAGLPSSLLERRPDLRATEQQLISANAAVGVAKAQFFPKLTLTGLLGAVSPQLSQLVASGTQWTAGAGLTGPIFTGGALKSQYRYQLALRDEAAQTYEKAVTSAFGEVSTALVTHQKMAEAIREQARSVTAYQESVRLANLRYNSGLSSYFEVIDAQLQLFPAQNASIQYELERKVALVNLYKALGGGWKLQDDQWAGH